MILNHTKPVRFLNKKSGKVILAAAGPGDTALKKMKSGALALGDTSYAQFCKTGENLDARLESLGAHRALPLKNVHRL